MVYLRGIISEGGSRRRLLSLDPPSGGFYHRHRRRGSWFCPVVFPPDVVVAAVCTAYTLDAAIEAIKKQCSCSGLPTAAAIGGQFRKEGPGLAGILVDFVLKSFQTGETALFPKEVPQFQSDALAI